MFLWNGSKTSPILKKRIKTDLFIELLFAKIDLFFKKMSFHQKGHEQVFYLKMWIAIPFRSRGSPAPAIVLKPWTKLIDVFFSGKSKGFHLSWLGLGCCSFQSWLRWSPYTLKLLSYEMNHVTLYLKMMIFQ